MKCCGEDRTTPFCPMCGKQLRQPHPLDSLVKHCQVTSKGQRSQAENYRRQAENYRRQAKTPDEEKAAWFDSLADAADKKASKWERWATAIEKLILKTPDYQ